MKFNNLLLALFISLMLIFTGCEDRSDLTAPGAPSTGSADFTTMVSLGNSLTAGFMNNALYESGQEYSYGSQIAAQVGISYEQPIISEPGIPGKMEIKEFVITNGNITGVVTTTADGMGSPKNASYSKPYNNLGVPGAIIYDLVDQTDFVTKSAQRNNPYFQAILRDQALGASPLQQALNLNPSLVTLWIGNNDVLGYASSGGTRGTDASGTMPTDKDVFAALIQQISNILSQSGADVVIANIPDINAVPYFTTVGPVMGVNIKPAIDAQQINGLYFQKNGETIGTGLAGYTDLVTGSVKIMLTGSAYASLLGQATDKYYTDNNIEIPAGIDVTKPFGFHPQNPWPNALILDQDETAIVNEYLGSFNATIKEASENFNFALVDINGAFKEIKDAEATGGKSFNGTILTTQYLSGGLFSLDGVHPTVRGQGVIANEFIKSINAKFDASIPMVNISELPGSIALEKASDNSVQYMPYFENTRFSDFIF